MPKLRSFTFPVLLVALAACTSDRAPSGLTGLERVDGVQSLLADASCDARPLNGAAKDYFGASRNPATGSIKTLIDACREYKNATSDAARTAAVTKANGAGFAILSEIGDEAASASPGTPGDGASLVRQVLVYMSIGTDETSGAFEGALSPGGMFRVRGASAEGLAVASRGGKPDWRIKGKWSETVLVYGYVTTENPGLTLISEANGRFDINVLPKPGGELPTSDGQVTLAYCAATGVDLTNRWVQHKPPSEETGYDFLSDQPSEVAALCAETGIAQAPTAPAVMLAAAEQAWRFFAPRDLFAQERIKTGGVGGFGSDLSPHFVANLGRTLPGFAVQPLNSVAGQPITTAAGEVLTVLLVSTNGGVPLKNVMIRLSVGNNSGTPAGAYMVCAVPAPGVSCANGAAFATTDKDGIASFPGVGVDKPGGYTLRAEATFDFFGTSTNFSTSDQFQVKNP